MFGDMLQDIVGQAIFEAAFYYVGLFAIRGLSFGRWRCLPVLSHVPRQDTRRGGLLHRRRDAVYFTSAGTAAVGGLVCLLLGLCVLLCWWVGHH
jgi:hypothetical protein